MPDITGFAHPEQANGAGDVYANNLTKFGQEVIADFKDRNQIGKLIRRKSIGSIEEHATRRFSGAGHHWQRAGQFAVPGMQRTDAGPTVSILITILLIN